MHATVNANKKPSSKLFRKIKAQRALLAMMIPGLIYYFVYRYLPIFEGILLSVKDFNLRKGVLNSPVMDPWYAHYRTFFQSTYCVRIIRNTLFISFSKMLIGIPLAVILALLLYECKRIKYRRIIQTVSYMPHFLSWVVIYGICFLLFSESTGLVNAMRRSLGIDTIKVFTNGQSFFWLVVFSDIWQSTGWAAIIYMAAISGIDPGLYEAAEIDGASRFQSLIYITLPSIAPVVIITMVLRCGSILDAGFEQILIMYNTAVLSTTDIIDTWVYRSGLENFNISLASAVGLFKSFVSFILVATVNQIARRWEGSLW